MKYEDAGHATIRVSSFTADLRGNHATIIQSRNGLEVGRLDLLHGQWVASPAFIGLPTPGDIGHGATPEGAMREFLRNNNLLATENG